jgi:N-acetylmuramate 1-kinase
MTNSRTILQKNFLKNSGISNYRSEKIKPDASHRSYTRIIVKDGSYMLMDAPPTKEAVKPFIEVASFLVKNGLTAPKIFVSDEENGFLLLQDFGDYSFTKLLSGNTEISKDYTEQHLYGRAIDALIALHKIKEKPNFPIFDEDMLIQESLQFIDWYIAVLHNEKLPKKDRDEFTIILKHALQYTKNLAPVVVLKDYHADNLMWLHEEFGLKKLGILDFQDAAFGSPAYDIVSLLEDARRDVGPDTTHIMINKYLKAFPSISRKDFLASYAIMGAQRNLKIIGFCARQAAENNNQYYLSLLPRVWGHLYNDLKNPLLLLLKEWMVKIVPSQIKNMHYTDAKIHV